MQYNNYPIYAVDQKIHTRRSKITCRNSVSKVYFSKHKISSHSMVALASELLVPIRER